LELETEGMGKTWVSAIARRTHHGVIPTSRHTRKTAMPRRIVMGDRFEDVTGI
jgi:hypothetical protein